MSEVLTASAVVQDDRGDQDGVAPDRVARGKPLEFVGGVPVYGSGRAPAYLRSKTQLGKVRRKPAAGQRPVAYIYTRWYGDRVALWDPEQAAKMRPLSALQRRQMRQRRTCTDCGEKFPAPVWGMCGRCRDREAQRRADLRRHTCQDCGTVFNTPAPAHGWRGALCLACDERIERGRRVAPSLVERSCRRCLAEMFPLTAWAAMSEHEQAMAAWHCTPCEREISQERAKAQRRADRDRWDDLGPTIAWAQKILADPDAYAILDTETTGLTTTSRIVEIAVTTAAGEVLLDTLLNPGEPIPAEATAIHGITDAMVEEGAPAFSELLPRLTEALAGRRVVIYNQEYDTGRLLWELHLHHLAHGPVDLTKHSRYGERRHPAARAWLDAQAWEECAMEQYAAFYGAWHDYFGSYTWQPLGGDHRALGDCQKVISRLKEMAKGRGFEFSEGGLVAELAGAASITVAGPPRVRPGPLNLRRGAVQKVAHCRGVSVWCERAEDGVQAPDGSR